MIDYDERTRTATITRPDRTVFTLRGVTRAQAETFHARYSRGSPDQTRERDGLTIEHRMGRA